MYQYYDPLADLVAALTDQATGLPLLNWVELYKGQLDEPENFDPPVLPACYIDVAPIDWENLRGHHQTGTGLVRIFTLLRLPARTHQTDPRRPDNTAAMSLCNTIHEALVVLPGVHGRVHSSTRWAAKGAVFVSEQHYRCRFDYAFAQYVQPEVQPPPLITATVTHLNVT